MVAAAVDILSWQVQACLQGQNDKEYAEIVSSIRAVLFLSTPHRGSNLAELLNRVLQVSIIHTPKAYVTELGRSAPFLQNINEDFRHFAPNLKIFSFYETLPTSVAGVKMVSQEGRI